MKRTDAMHPTQVPGRSKALLLAVIAGIAVAIAVGLLWNALDQQERAQVERTNRSTLVGMEALLRKDFDARIIALTGLARTWERSGGLTRGEWDVAAQSVYDSQPGFQSVAWIDPSYQIRWVTPLTGNEILQDFDLRNNPGAIAAAKEARSRGSYAFSPSQKTIHGLDGNVLYVPIYGSDREGMSPERKQLEGFVGSAWLLDPLLQNVVPEGLVATHELMIFVDGKSFYSSNSGDQAAPSYWSERRFTMHNHEWIIKTFPKAEWMNLLHSRFQTIIAVGGAVLSILVALAVYYALVALRWARDARELSQRISLLFENLPGIAYRCHNDPAWSMLIVSAGCEAVSGYSPVDLTQGRRNWGDIIHPDDKARVWQDIQAAISTGEAFGLEYRIITSSGEERWVWDRGRAIAIDDKGSSVLEGFISDITIRKRAQAEKEEEKDLAAGVINSAIEAIVTVGSNDRIETFNPAAEKIYGYDLDEILGKKFEVLLPHDLRPRHREIMANYHETGVISFTPDEKLKRSLRKDGTVFPNQFSVSTINHQGQRKFAYLMRDMSEQNAASEEARRLRDDLAHVERLHSLGEMASGLAHELNQPLTAISNYMATARDMLDGADSETKAMLQEAMHEASSESLRAGKIVRRLREFIAKGVVDKQIHFIAKLIEDATALALVGAHHEDIEWSVEIAPGSFRVLADSTQIQQVMVNLIRNAVEAMSDCEVKRLTISAKPGPGNDIEIAVQDTGSGLSDDIKGRLFSAFASTKADGMGLGLSICKTIIEDHGGKIFAELGPGGGTIFRFTLPLFSEQVVDE